MAPNRPAGESSRRVNRHLNASPYARKVPNQPRSNPQADAGQVKKSASLAGLFSIFNPFNYLGKRNEPPQSLPQLRARNESSSQEEEETGHESDTHTELDLEGDSMFVDHTLRGPLASSQKSPEKYRPNQIPFPLVSPAKDWETAPGASRRGNVAPTTNAFSRGQFAPASPASSAHTSATVGQTAGSPLKPIQDFLGQRTRAGAGLSPEEVQQLTGMLSAQSIGRDESDLPTAAFLARDFSPSPSRSFLAPQQASSSPFRFEAGNNAGSTVLSSAPPSRQRRHRPVYVGPGQGSNLRPSRSSIVMPPISSSLPRPSIPSTVADLQLSEEVSGKRRRVDGLHSSAAPPSFKASETNAVAAPSQPSSEAHTDIPPASSSTSTSGASRTVPSLVSARGGPLRGHATASPAVPSPLRKMTKADDPPSPPRRSLTSAAVMNIIAKADKELSVSESKAEVEQAIVNPYERTGPKISMANRRKPVPIKKPAPPPPKAEPKKPELPSSAQAIADSLPTPKGPAAKPSANGSVFKAPFAKSTSSSSPFLPPGKAAPATKTNGSSSGPFTIDDIDDEDEIMEVGASEGSPSKSQANGSSSRARGPSPPPVVVEEMSEEEMAESSQKAAKPSLVVEPTESKRIGRSPSLGPYSNLYSPTIPSPLRLMSMPEEDELAEDVEILDATAQPKQSIPRAPALELGPQKSSDVDMADPKSQAEKTSRSSLPSYEFDFSVAATATVPGIDISAKAKALAVLKNDLPKFDMLAAVSAPVQTTIAPANNWAAAGFAPKAASSSWTCSTCMLSNPESAKDKCTVCDADRPGAKTKPTSTAPPPSQSAPTNNWAASGFAFAAPAAGTWTCTSCMLTNPASAKDKCTVCEATRDAPGSNTGTTTNTSPATAPPPTQPTPSFNWSAAGFQPKTVAPGTWTCSVCGLSNGPELTKCGVCETTR
ncbi:hypothetical protein FRC05_006629 [Tulasnella sp. 425]|nr:hypothetical protein FRC05_006629 [Tulasnella sp. 425]